MSINAHHIKELQIKVIGQVKRQVALVTYMFELLIENTSSAPDNSISKPVRSSIILSKDIGKRLSMQCPKLRVHPAPSVHISTAGCTILGGVRF